MDWWKEITPVIADAAVKQCRDICITIVACFLCVGICSCTAISVKGKMKADEAKYIYLAEELKNK